MVAQPRRVSVTREEYLERERRAETKSEYDDGVIVAMAGSSPEHAAITFNFGVQLAPHLAAAGWRAFSSDLRVRVDASNRYCYPDLAVVCGKPEFESLKGMRTLRNPALIVEVLSESTEKRDRGSKWLAYKTLDSLNAYVLVHQDRPYIEIYSRQGVKWEYGTIEGLESTVELPGFAPGFALSTIYADTDFGSEA